MKRFKNWTSKEKQDLYKKLGADFWQKVVFKVEEIKYKLLKKIPNVSGKLDKIYDIRYKSLIKKAKSPEEEENIKAIIRNDKLAARKEMVFEENRNYHFDPLHPEEFIKFLDYNKNVHLKGMGVNIGSLAALGVSTLFIPANLLPAIIMFAALQVVGLYVNFECVNLQNYNLERFNDERLMKILKARAAKKVESESEEYKNATSKVSMQLKKSSSIPPVSDIIASFETEEEKQEFAKMLIKQKSKLKEKRR